MASLAHFIVMPRHWATVTEITEKNGCVYNGLRMMFLSQFSLGSVGSKGSDFVS